MEGKLKKRLAMDSEDFLNNESKKEIQRINESFFFFFFKPLFKLCVMVCLVTLLFR